MKNIVSLASDYVTSLYENHLRKKITYHNFVHTKEVIETAKLIGENSGLSNEQMEILLLAAWFHDIGIILQYNEHEEKSAEICREFLMKQSYSQDKINDIVEIIRSTRIPQKPKTLLAKILCDADLSYTGKKEFNHRSQLLRTEWRNMLNKNFSDSEWLKNNLDFLLENKFHTNFARSFYDNQRKQNSLNLKKKIKELGISNIKTT
jgi:HD superfamily phosphodiesterase